MRLHQCILRRNAEQHRAWASGIGAGVGIQAVAGNQLTLEFAADVCITSPQRFGRWMFRVGRCPRMMLEIVLQACNISQQGIQVLCR